MFALLFPYMCGACRAYLDQPGLCDLCRGAVFDIKPGCRTCLEPLSSVDCDETCERCRLRKPDFDLLKIPWEYEGVVAEILLRAKNGQLADLRSLVACWERDWLRFQSLEGAQIAILPSSPSRIRSRGYEMTTLIAKWAKLGAQWPLKKVVENEEQKGLNRFERERNVDDIFECKPLQGAWVLLDDVVTTGATMSAAARTMKEAGATSVLGLALARTINPPD